MKKPTDNINSMLHCFDMELKRFCLVSGRIVFDNLKRYKVLTAHGREYSREKGYIFSYDLEQQKKGK